MNEYVRPIKGTKAVGTTIWTIGILQLIYCLGMSILTGGFFAFFIIFITFWVGASGVVTLYVGFALRATVSKNRLPPTRRGQLLQTAVVGIFILLGLIALGVQLSTGRASFWDGVVINPLNPLFWDMLLWALGLVFLALPLFRSKV